MYPGMSYPPPQPAYSPYPPPPIRPSGTHQPSTGRQPTNDTGVKAKRRLVRDPLSVVLILVTVVALGVGGLIGAEFFGRHVAETKVAQATECVTKDKASVTFGVAPPFLYQHITGRYTGIAIQTAGNQIKEARGMTAVIDIYDADLHGTADSKGTIGALNATFTWSTNGIKDTVQNLLPVVGSFVKSVMTNPDDGTVELKSELGLANVKVKPQVVDNSLSLQVVGVSGLGMPILPTETVQPALDTFTKQLTNRFPLGIRPDSVRVTGAGVVGHFSTRHVTIPARTEDPCFGKL
jgi:hypothetical protein